jgi:hypothetical protein
MHWCRDRGDRNAEVLTTGRGGFVAMIAMFRFSEASEVIAQEVAPEGAKRSAVQAS